MVDAGEGGGKVLVVSLGGGEKAIEFGVAEGGVGFAGGGRGRPVGVFESVGKVVTRLLVVGADVAAGGRKETVPKGEKGESGAVHGRVGLRSGGAWKESARRRVCKSRLGDSSGAAV